MGMNLDDEQPRRIIRPRIERGGYAATSGPTQAELTPPPDAVPDEQAQGTEAPPNDPE
jgi:hypothetical protein